MVVTVQERSEQALLGRSFVYAHASFDAATPSKMDIRKQLAKELKVDEKLLVVRHIYTGFGKRSARVVAVVYDDVKTAVVLENKKLIEQHGIGQDDKKSSEDKGEQVKE